jgi:hypothetical protein
MGLEENIDKLLAGETKPRKLSMQRARMVEDALRREDEYALRQLGLQGVVIFNVGSQRWVVASEYQTAYYEALAKLARAARVKASSQRQRAAVYGSLGMKRTRFGGWE